MYGGLWWLLVLVAAGACAAALLVTRTWERPLNRVAWLQHRRGFAFQAIETRDMGGPVRMSAPLRRHGVASL